MGWFYRSGGFKPPILIAEDNNMLSTQGRQAQGRQAQEKAHKPMVFNFNKDLIRAEVKDERKWAHEMVGSRQFRINFV